MSVFASCVAELPDPRSPHGRRHSLFSVIAICCCAILAGRRTFSAIHQWSADAPHVTLEALGCRQISGICFPPSYNTLRRVIGAGRRVLSGHDLTGTVVTADAHHTQTATAEAILEADGDYALLTKGNQPTLQAQVKALP